MGKRKRNKHYRYEESGEGNTACGIELDSSLTENTLDVDCINCLKVMEKNKLLNGRDKDGKFTAKQFREEKEKASTVKGESICHECHSEFESKFRVPVRYTGEITHNIITCPECAEDLDKKQNYEVNL